MHRVLGDNFPERLAKVIVYPVPRFANVIWSAAQKFMDPTTAAKVQLYANSQEAGERDVPSRTRHRAGGVNILAVSWRLRRREVAS